jgi:virginiamycin A acetyltransferase
MIKDLLRPIKHQIKLAIFKKEWRKHNSHNYTIANSIFTMEKVSVEKNTYGLLNITDYENSLESLSIGNYCCISDNVKFILGGEHHPQYLSNYPFKMHLSEFNAIDDRKSKGPIIIGDDVWIGYGSIILSGVTIGQGAVIAAGSVVTKNVPPYAVYTTNRIIKYRFSPEIIEKLLKLDYNKINYELVKEHIELFYTELNEEILSSPSLLELMS